MLQSSDGAIGDELRQPVVMIGDTPLDQLLKRFDDQARFVDPLSVHLAEVWEWQYFWAAHRFLEQNTDLPAEQLEQVKAATGYEACQQWLAEPAKTLARKDIDQIRRDFLAEFGPGE